MIKKFKEHIDFFNAAFNFIKNFGAIITLVGGIAVSILDIDAIKLFLANTLKISPPQVISFLVNKKIWVWIAFGIFVFLILLSAFLSAVKARVDNIKQMTSLLKQIHLDYIHEIRNRMAEMQENLPNRIKEVQDSEEDMKKLYDKELEHLKGNLQPIVDKLSDHLYKYRNQKISVCIKTFVNGSCESENYLQEEVTTMARSSNTKASRNNRLVSKVCDNTDFIDLSVGKIMYFGKSNLKQLYEDNLYKNSTPQWWTKYNSTLVVPIRYHNKEPEKTNMNIEIDLIGFLCIDCKEIIPEWENADSYEFQLLAVIADSLYTYLKMYYNFFNHAGYFEKRDNTNE